mgnify:CR=1 FL=1
MLKPSIIFMLPMIAADGAAADETAANKATAIDQPSRSRAARLGFILMLLLSTLLGACSSALPRTEDTTRSRWNHFEDALADYNKIIPQQTTTEELKALGYDPYTQPNIRILSYLEVTQRFMPNQSITLDDLDPGISDCVRAKSKCMAYEAHPKRIKSKRVGNAFLDVLTFKRRTIETGWSFDALIVINDGIVVYKVWSGQPIVSGEKVRKNPLGPLQGIDGSAIRNAL